jgi:hypothetical protein
MLVNLHTTHFIEEGKMADTGKYASFQGIHDKLSRSSGWG